VDGTKVKFAAIMVVFLGVLMCSGLVYAEELTDYGGSINALSSGYAITRWPPGNGTILVGENATVRAYTTEYPAVTHVEFRWIRPDGSSCNVGPKPLNPGMDTWDGGPTWYAEDNQTIDMVSTPTEDWGVQAMFGNLTDGKWLPIATAPVMKIKAISWHAVPQVPLGTIAVIISMFAGLGVFALKRKTR